MIDRGPISRLAVSGVKDPLIGVCIEGHTAWGVWLRIRSRVRDLVCAAGRSSVVFSLSFTGRVRRCVLPPSKSPEFLAVLVIANGCPGRVLNFSARY